MNSRFPCLIDRSGHEWFWGAPERCQKCGRLALVTLRLWPLLRCPTCWDAWELFPPRVDMSIHPGVPAPPGKENAAL